MITRRDWAALDKRLDKWSPPDGDFDPTREWSLHYARHALIPGRDGSPGGGQVGSLHIKHTPEKERVRLNVSEVEKAGSTTLTTSTAITCSSDVLLTPRHWSVSCHWETPLTVVKTDEMNQQHKGRIEGNELVFNGAKERRSRAPQKWTSNWNLFAAIQRMPFNPDTTHRFDLLESLDLLKPDQRIVYAGKHPLTLGDKKLNLHVFEQTGRGVMPWHWWLDEKHRVVLAAGNRRAYLLMTSVQGGES